MKMYMNKKIYITEFSPAHVPQRRHCQIIKNKPPLILLLLNYIYFHSCLNIKRKIDVGQNLISCWHAKKSFVFLLAFLTFLPFNSTNI